MPCGKKLLMPWVAYSRRNRLPLWQLPLSQLTGSADPLFFRHKPITNVATKDHAKKDPIHLVHNHNFSPPTLDPASTAKHIETIFNLQYLPIPVLGKHCNLFVTHGIYDASSSSDITPGSEVKASKLGKSKLS